MKHSRIASLFVSVAVLSLALSACQPPPVKPARPDSSALGIMLEQRWSPNGSGRNADRVYFIRWNDRDDPTAQRDIIKSNYARGNRVYLLNAKPGRYSAVAASDFFAQLKRSRVLTARNGMGHSMFNAGPTAQRRPGGLLPTMPAWSIASSFHTVNAQAGALPGTAAAGATSYALQSGANPGNSTNNGLLLAQADSDIDSGDSLDDFHVSTTYFSEQLVRRSSVEVGPGEFKVMGEFIVQMDYNIEGADKVQAYFHRIINPFMDDPNGMPFLDVDSSTASRATLIREFRNREAQVKFLNLALKDLADSPWSGIVRRSLEALR